MKSIIVTICLLSSLNILASKNHCQDLEQRLERVQSQLKKRTENFRELQFQQSKLKKRINKKCVGLNKKLENAFIKSSFSN